MYADELRVLLGINYGELRQFLDNLCAQSGNIARTYFRQPISVELKADASPVTRADREIEACLRAAILKQFPDHAVLGEEFGGIAQTQGPLWVLDPIDGTKNFISGKPLFGTLISLCVSGVPQVGVIDVPALNERWMAAGEGVTCGTHGLSQTSTVSSLAKACLYATSPDMFSERRMGLF